MKKVIIGIFVLLLFVVAGELIYLNFIQKSTPVPSQSTPKTSTPVKSAPENVGTLKFITYSEVEGMEIRLEDPEGLKAYLREKGILTRMETGMAVLGESDLHRASTVEFVLVSEKQIYLKMLSRDEGNLEIRSVGSQWDAATATYRFNIYLDSQKVEEAKQTNDSSGIPTQTIIEALYTVSTLSIPDDEYVAAVDGFRGDIMERDLKFFTVE